MENKKNIYKRQTIVSLIISILFTIFFVYWFKQPNANEAVWINGLFLLIPLIIAWTFSLSHFNKYRKEN
jgi:hypothetical protein